MNTYEHPKDGKTIPVGEAWKSLYQLPDGHPYKKPPLTQDQARKAAERAEHLTEEEIDRIFHSVRNPMREKWMNDIDPGWTSGTVATAVVIGALAVCALVFFGWLVVG